MTLFTPQSAPPRVFALPPGVDFGQALLDGLHTRLAGQGPEALARVEILVNTRRTQRRLQSLYEAGPARLLPRLSVVTDLGAGMALADPPVPALRRRLELTRLIGALIDTDPSLAERSAAFDLAGSLAALMDEMQAGGLGWEALDRIDPGNLSAHWQRSLRFLTLIRPFLCQSTDAEARQRAAVEARIAAWKANPPEHPVLIAGSTGSRPPTAMLMEAVAALPQGAVILPGFDSDLPAPVWEALAGSATSTAATDHPQFGFSALAGRIGFDPAALPVWHETPPPSPARNCLISLALRPAPVTHQWLDEGPELVPSLAEATDRLTLIEAADPRDEARTIALRLRLALDEGRAAALVSPDRNLTRRVTALLDRWRIVPDDSAGRPLSLTPPGVFLRLTLALTTSRPTPVELLALLKHPLAGGENRGAHLTLTRALEIGHLRGGAPFIDWDDLRRWAQTRTEDLPEAAPWIDWLADTLAPLGNPAPRPLAAHLETHIAAAEALSRGPKGDTVPLWERKAGEEALKAIAELRAAAEAGGTVIPADYRAIFSSVIAREVPAEPVTAHGDIAIWGTLEARTQSAPLVILGALNEGSWPRLPDPDPWLNREMRRTLGLPAPERRIGLSAHDFQQALGAQEVVLTRALRDDEAPTVPSRWWLRLTNLLTGLGPEGEAALKSMQARGQALRARAARLDAPTETVPPAPRPAPSPPLAARPVQLSVTRIETLTRDPYQIYASNILGLKRLDPPGRAPDALARGTAIHTVMERFARATLDGLPEDAPALFDRITAETFAEAAPWPATRRLWIARLARIRDRFLAAEAERRTAGTLQDAGLEAKGRRELTLPTGIFTLTAKADRIDRSPRGGWLIYDYKSGAVSSPNQIRVYDWQLPLEAAIAEAGGFEGLPPAPVAAMSLLSLASDTRIVMLSAAEIDIAAVWNEFRQLLTAYADVQTGYASRLRPARMKYETDYDQLSRLGEWADGDPIELIPVGGRR